MEFAVVLHNVRSLHNVGSVFRTADGAGVKKIFLCGVTPAPVDSFGKVRPQFAKASLGAERYVKWEKAYAAGKTIKALKSEGYEILEIPMRGKKESLNVGVAFGIVAYHLSF